MKKSIFLALALLIAFPAFAVDTALEGLTLTEKQLTQASVLTNDTIKGFSAWADKTVVVSTRQLSAEEQSALRASLAALPDEYTKEALEKRFNVLLFTDRLNKSFTSEEAVALMPYYAAIKDLASWPDFADIKKILLGLMQAGILSEAGYAKIAGLLLEQGIDLNNYEVV